MAETGHTASASLTAACRPAGGRLFTTTTWPSSSWSNTSGAIMTQLPDPAQRVASAPTSTTEG
jgi:hypothetical protein